MRTNLFKSFTNLFRNSQNADGNGGGTPQSGTDDWSRRAFWLSTIILLALFVLALIYGAQHHHHAAGKPKNYPRLGLEWAGPLTAGLVLLIGLVSPGWKRGGIVGYIVGTDNRLSTSKLQIGLWTIAVAFAFTLFSVEVAYGLPDSTMFNALGGGYLLLLGGPFAAAVLAKATTSAQADEGTLAQTPAPSPSVADLINGHTDNPSITDAQFLLFNLVALIYFAVKLVNAPTLLPTMPDTLVGLTSVSALTYLGAKVVSGSSPRISSIGIVPATGSVLDGKITTGDTLRIIGTGFRPEGASGTGPVPIINGAECAPTNAATDTEVDVRVPAVTSGTTLSVQVRTSYGALADPNMTLIVR